MNPRTGTWFDVRVKGQVIGCVKPVGHGRWEAYMTYQHKAGSTLVATCNTRAEAERAVYQAAWG